MDSARKALREARKRRAEAKAGAKTSFASRLSTKGGVLPSLRSSQQHLESSTATAAAISSSTKSAGHAAAAASGSVPPRVKQPPVHSASNPAKLPRGAREQSSGVAASTLRHSDVHTAEMMAPTSSPPTSRAVHVAEDVDIDSELLRFERETKEAEKRQAAEAALARKQVLSMRKQASELDQSEREARVASLRHRHHELRQRLSERKRQRVESRQKHDRHVSTDVVDGKASRTVVSSVDALALSNWRAKAI